MHRAVDESNSSHTIDPNTTDGSGVETPVVVRYYRLGTTQRHQTDRMLQDIKERILQKRREEYAEKDCTFRPQTERPPSTNVSVGKWSNESASSEQVYSRLSRYAEERSRRLEEKSRQKERNEDEALHGLFQPIINSRKFNRSYSTASAPVEERLLNYGEEVNLSLEAKRKEREQRLEWEMRHPSHSVQSTAESAASFDYRNQTLLQKRERLWVEAERKLRDGASFAPKVCPTSSAIDYANLKKSGLNAAFPGSNDRGALLYYTHQATGEELSRAEQEAERAARYANRPQTKPQL
ncbi:hypothetical protein ADEAN_000049000 [Angomonas deanei]|uniref:Uncharacterized protein n=1 Tax=Angomonas deanei TaxID=59799 RepID=A0A7G2C166_9TRYP|nr:hypothetical protein ADEAN_000049000 [Angomonas deanei]